MDAYILDWINLILRFVHVVTGIAWIGASFYFVWLDNHLETPPQWKTDKGIKGDLWAIHGGGIYEVAKYHAAPEHMPKILHWFKWEAYSTWLSGTLLLCVIYYLGAEAYLIDPRVADLSQIQAIGIGISTLVGGWVVYELLCNSPLGKNGVVLGVLLIALATALSYGLSTVFSARGAYIHIGALVGTIMVGNVFRVIIPSQKALVKAVTAGEAPDPAWGIKAKLRSTHNTYTTLPLVFVMLSMHYPMTYNHEYGWLVLIALFIITAAARWYFVLRHFGKQNIFIPVGVFVATLALAYAMSLKPSTSHSTEISEVNISKAGVVEIVATHCTSCHASNPTDDVFKVAPLGLILESYDQMIQQAPLIKARAVDTHDMPMLNKTNMSQAERDYLRKWIDEGLSP